MTRPRIFPTFSPARPCGMPHALRCLVLAGLSGACWQAAAEPGRRIVDDLLSIDARTISTAVPIRRTAAGEGLTPSGVRGNPAPAREGGSGILDLLLSRVRDTEVGAALAQFDAGQADDSLRFGVAAILPGERLVVRGKLHASRHHNRLGSQVLPGDRYQVFSEVGLAFRLRHDLAIGVEYRSGPDRARAAGPFGSRARDGAWKDLYLKWSLSHAVSLTAAWVDLGSIVHSPGSGRQIGQYLSAEFRY